MNRMVVEIRRHFQNWTNGQTRLNSEINSQLSDQLFYPEFKLVNKFVIARRHLMAPFFIKLRDSAYLKMHGNKIVDFLSSILVRHLEYASKYICEFGRYTVKYL